MDPLRVTLFYLPCMKFIATIFLEGLNVKILLSIFTGEPDMFET